MAYNALIIFCERMTNASQTKTTRRD